MIAEKFPPFLRRRQIRIPNKTNLIFAAAAAAAGATAVRRDGSSGFVGAPAAAAAAAKIKNGLDS